MQAVKNDLDFSKQIYRKIALKFCYFGWNYDGLAVQGPQSPNTIEARLFDALVRTRLLPASEGLGLWKPSDFQKCGRTDKGVSAMSQVVSFYVRSNISPSHPDANTYAQLMLRTYPDTPIEEVKPRSLSSEQELQYVLLLNRCLPEDIRVLAWCPVPRNFSARFDCRFREYKYTFPIEHLGQNTRLDLDKMRIASQQLVGEHNFINFCKVNGTETSFCRRVISADIEQIDQDFACFTIRGSAFLWHQVRYTMAVLYLIGSGQRPVDFVDKLLEAKEFVKDYPMASEVPLMLWDCGYDSLNFPKQDQERAKRMFMKQQQVHATKAQMMLKMVNDRL